MNPHAIPIVEQWVSMRPKIKDLISQLEQAGFRDRGWKGSQKTMYTQTYLNRLLFQGERVAVLNFIKLELL